MDRECTFLYKENNIDVRESNENLNLFEDAQKEDAECMQEEYDFPNNDTQTFLDDYFLSYSFSQLLGFRYMEF